MINLNQLTSSKKIKYLTNYVKLSQSHKRLEKKGSLHSNQVNKSKKYQENSHLQYCQRLSLKINNSQAPLRSKTQSINTCQDSFQRKHVGLLKKSLTISITYMSASHSILHYT